MLLFVYGTLKKGGVNHSAYLKNSTFVGQYRLSKVKLVDYSHGFPYLLQGSSKDFVYGELYDVTPITIKHIDRLESVGYLYDRKIIKLSKTDYPANNAYYANDDKMDLNYYQSRKLDYEKTNLIKNGYWQVKNPVIFNVYIDNRKYSDVATKLIFHMRFFDGDRTPTNFEYMKLVKARCHIDELSTDNQELFIRQCIFFGIITEFDKPKIVN